MIMAILLTCAGNPECRIELGPHISLTQCHAHVERELREIKAIIPEATGNCLIEWSA